MAERRRHVRSTGRGALRRPRRGRSVPARLVAIGVAAGALAGCSAGSPDQPTAAVAVAEPTASTTETIDPSNTTVIDLAGVTLEVPAGAASSTGTVTAKVGEAPVTDGLEPVGVALEAHLDGTTLTQPARITWHITPPADLGESTFAPFVVSVADNGDVEAVESSWDPVANVLTAHPRHFSFQVPAWLNPKRHLEKLVSGLGPYLTGRANAAAASCDRQEQARAGGLELRSSNGDLVKWCVGMDGTATIVKIVNNRNIAVTVTFAQLLTPRDSEGSGVSTESVGRWISSMAPPPAGAQIRVLGGGQTLTLEVPAELPAGSQLGADIEVDLLTYAFAGVDLALNAAGEALIGAASKALKKTDIAREAFADSSELLNCLRTQLTAEMDPRGRAGETASFADDAVIAMKIGLDCGLEFIPAYATKVGTTAGSIVAVVVSALVGLIRDGVGMITGAIRYGVDMITGDDVYQFRLVTPAATAPAPAPDQDPYYRYMTAGLRSSANSELADAVADSPATGGDTRYTTVYRDGARIGIARLDYYTAPDGGSAYKLNWFDSWINGCTRLSDEFDAESAQALDALCP